MATYKVKKGDNYQKIAEQYKVPTSQLVRMNKSVPLSAGQAIKIPNIGEPIDYTPPRLPYQNPIGPVIPNQYSSPLGPQPRIYGPPKPPQYSSPIGPNLPQYGEPIGPQPRIYGPFLPPSQAQGSFVSGGGLVPPTTTQQAYLSQFPGQGTIGGVAGQAGAAARLGGTSSGVTTLAARQQQQQNNAFPGFWGGGKNGGFYKTLRQAKIATRRHRQAQGDEGENQAAVYTPPAPTVLGDRTDAVNWNVG